MTIQRDWETYIESFILARGATSLVFTPHAAEPLDTVRVGVDGRTYFRRGDGWLEVCRGQWDAEYQNYRLRYRLPALPVPVPPWERSEDDDRPECHSAQHKNALLDDLHRDISPLPNCWPASWSAPLEPTGCMLTTPKPRYLKNLFRDADGT